MSTFHDLLSDNEANLVPNCGGTHDDFHILIPKHNFVVDLMNLS